MRRWGELWETAEKNPGGDPAKVKEGAVTLDEMGVTYNFASECGQMWRMPQTDFDEYLALSEKADDQSGTSQTATGDTPRYVELTKGGLLNRAAHLRTIAEREQRAAAARQQAEAEAAAAEDTKRESATKGKGHAGSRSTSIGASSGGTSHTGSGSSSGGPPPPPPGGGSAGTCAEEEEPQFTYEKSEPPKTPERPPEPKAPSLDRLKAMLRVIVDPDANENERATAMVFVQRNDKRLEILDKGDVGDRMEFWFNETQFWRERFKKENEKQWNYYQTLEKMNAELTKLRARDRRRLEVINDQKREVDRLNAALSDNVTYREEFLKAEFGTAADIVTYLTAERTREELEQIYDGLGDFLDWQD